MANIRFYIYNNENNEYQYSGTQDLTTVPRIGEEIEYHHFYTSKKCVVANVVHNIDYDNIRVYVNTKDNNENNILYNS